MHATEIVVREVQRNPSFQVRQFLAESVCEPRESANRHSHSEVLPFDVTREMCAGSTHFSDTAMLQLGIDLTRGQA
jgi:hypothetical protein